MRVLLIYPDLNIHVNYPVGLGLISACLKKSGHNTRVVHINEELGFPLDLPRIKRIVEDFSPQLIGFSSTSNQYKFVRTLAPFFKKILDVPIICGGVHPTIAPEEVLSSDGVDLVCIGEGEYAMQELVEKLEKGDDYRGIRNLGYLEKGKVVLNPMRPLVGDLNSLPFPDREGFQFADIVSLKNGWANVMVGRGCLYQCTYCINNYFHKIYESLSTKGGHVRFRTVDTVLAEIEELLGKYDIRLINFDDDIFTLKKDWLSEFCAKYGEKIKVPFACNVQVRHFGKNVAEMLYKAGCREVKIGLESGNEQVRKNVLKRHTPDDVIIKAFKDAEDAGIRAWAFNMMGVPSETKSDLMDTVRLNAKIRPYILRCSIFYPYKGTELYEYCETNSLLNEEKEGAYSSHLEGSVLKLRELSEAEIIKTKQMFKWLVDSESGLEVSGFYKMLVSYFDQLPAEYWLNGEAQRMLRQVDESADGLFRMLKKEHYASRKHLDLNFTPRLNFEMP